MSGRRMRFASAMSSHRDTGAALDEVLEAVEAIDVDVAFLFASMDHGPRLQEAARVIEATLPGVALVGCTAAGTVGGGEEREDPPTLSLTVGKLPGVQATPFHLTEAELPEDPDGWRSVTRADQACVVLSDPFSVNLAPVLSALQAALPNTPLVGGQASGGRRPGEHLLVAGSSVHRDGLVGLGLRGPVLVEAFVAQGCRPVGPPMFVSSCDGNRILALDGRDPVEALRDVFESLSPADRDLFRGALFIGVQMREQHEYHPGDFLIRNIVGIPKDGRGLVVAYLPERFSVIQLHLRDAEAARADLEAVLDVHAPPVDGMPPAGALLFTCVGRGSGLYGTPSHDSGAFRRRFGAVPLGGFFCNGEVGPVQGQTFVHGYTSVFATFRSPDVA